MNTNRRTALGALGLGVAAALTAYAAPAGARHDDAQGFRSGMVFTSSNAQAGNELLVYERLRDGSLAARTRVPTGGQGSGAGLGSQGAVTLSGDARFLFVVNALSNTVSTFEVGKRELRLASVVGSGGLHPISVTEHDGVVVVLNDAGAGNLVGFRNRQGQLERIPGAEGALSTSTGAAPAQVGFGTDGDVLVVTEKATNRVSSYLVGRNGRIGAPIVTLSPGQTPFGFAFDGRNRLVVSEAAGGAARASSVSMYRFRDADPARPRVASAAVPNGQSAACWVAITPNDRWAYVSNTGSGTISAYDLRGGEARLAHAIAGRTGVGSTPGDSAVSADGGYFYVRSGATMTISAFEIEHDGRLTALAPSSGLPPSAVGLAAN